MIWFGIVVGRSTSLEVERKSLAVVAVVERRCLVAIESSVDLSRFH